MFIDSVLVSVMIPAFSYSVDMDLPAHMEIQDLTQEILKVLKKIISVSHPEIMRVTRIARIKANGQYINAGNTLYEFGVWDGSTMIIEI